MADNATSVLDVIETLNTIANDTLPEPPSVWATLQDVSFLMLELKLVASAIGIIYVGAHAALRRPPSAAPSKKRKPGQKSDEDEDVFQQGLELTDAIIFPIMAGVVLVGLYYLIQWLQDPDLLNKILRWYMSTMSVFSLLSLYYHAMELITSFVFPRYWSGSDGRLRMANQKDRNVVVCDDVGNATEGPSASDNPYPGLLSLLAWSDKAKKAAWNFRDLLTRHWILKVYAHGVGEESNNIKFSHMLSLVAAVGTALIYSSMPSSVLANVLGYGLCYGSFMILSPTDLLIGTLVLVGLFFYDIVMVFYTPYMVTVATTLDAPIKLTFEVASRKSILGLGDIVLPGIVMAWALRLDLWLHYQRKVKYEATDLKLVEKDATTGAIVTRTETKHKEIKVPYVNAQGGWAERFWIQGVIPFTRTKELPAEIAASRFPKTYFHATVVGYSLGMLATLAMLLIFNRGQPALLYLVPGVLASLYLTAIFRGELKLIWSYTEDGSMDTTDVVVDLDGDGNAVKRIGELKDGVVDTTKDEKKDKDKDGKEGGNKDGNGVSTLDVSKKASETEPKGSTGGHRVFSISLDTPSDE